jgi:hypothetical protein
MAAARGLVVLLLGTLLVAACHADDYKDYRAEQQAKAAAATAECTQARQLGTRVRELPRSDPGYEKLLAEYFGSSRLCKKQTGKPGAPFRPPRGSSHPRHKSGAREGAS